MIHRSFVELRSGLGEVELTDAGFAFSGKYYSYDASKDKAAFLSNVLYKEWYATKTFNRWQSDSSVLEKQQFLAKLSAANTTNENYFAGWTVKEIHGKGQLTVTKFGSDKILNTGQHQFNDVGLSPGQPITFKTRKENAEMQQDFYYAMGEVQFEYLPTIIRMYWNIAPEAAAPLVNQLTVALNAYKIPFLFKCLDHPSLYYRRDCCVLYVGKRYMRVVTDLLPRIHSAIEAEMHDDVPLFTYKLRKGLGYAESPVYAESFGMNRITLVAKALINSFAQNEITADQQMQHVFNQFALNGISIEAPYLNAGSIKY